MLNGGIGPHAYPLRIGEFVRGFEKVSFNHTGSSSASVSGVGFFTVGFDIGVASPYTDRDVVS